MVATGGTTKRITLLLDYVTKGAEKLRSNALANNVLISKQESKYQSLGRSVEKVSATIRNLTKRQNNLLAEGKTEQAKAMGTEITAQRSRKRLISDQISGMKSKSATEISSARTTRLNTQAGLGFRKVLGSTPEAFKEFHENGRKYSTLGGRMGSKIRFATAGLKGFKMEMLGVMFFGMALQRTMQGLLKTSLDWVGITELLSLTLGVFFLPVALELLEIMLPIFDGMMNASEATKLWIGRLVVGTAVLGAFLFIVGQTFLGLGSVVIAFGGMLLFLPLIIIAVAAGIAIFSKFKIGTENVANALDSLDGSVTGFGITGPGVIKDAVNQMIEKIRAFGETDFAKKVITVAKNIWDTFTGFFTEDENRQKLIGGWFTAMSALVDSVSSWVDANSSMIGEIGVKIGEIIWKAIKATVKTAFKNFFGVSFGTVLGGATGFVLSGGNPLVAAAGAGIGGYLGGAGEKAGTDAFNRRNGIGGRFQDPGLLQSISEKERVQNVINVINNNNVEVSDTEKWKRLMDENNRNQTSEIRRLLG